MKKKELDNIISMLSSKDKENHVVALSVIEETQKEDSIVALMLGIKHGTANEGDWLLHAPKALDRVKRLLGSSWREDMNITFKTMFDVMTKSQQKDEQVALFMEYFTEYLTNQLQSMGYTFIKEIKVITNE